MFSIATGDHLPEQAYFNIFDFPRIKLTNRFGKFNANKKKFIQNKHLWISHNDSGLNDSLKHELRSRFNIRSKFEI